MIKKQAETKKMEFDIKLLFLSIVFSGLLAGVLFWFLIAPDIGQEKVKEAFAFTGNATEIQEEEVSICIDSDHDNYFYPPNCAEKTDCDDSNPGIQECAQ